MLQEQNTGYSQEDNLFLLSFAMNYDPDFKQGIFQTLGQ